MIQSARSLALHLARVGAIVFALTACGYLVVTAQRRANPVMEDEHPASDSDGVPMAVPAEGDATFLPSSKVLIIDGPAALGSNGPEPLSIEWRPDDATFLLGTKSAALPSAVFEEGAEVPTTSGNVSSKLDPNPSPGAPSQRSPSKALAEPGAPGGASRTSEPVFLPSSKVKTLSPLRPQSLAPGTTSTSERVFLPSSKSLRIGEGKSTTRAPAPKPAPTPAPMPTDAPTPAPTEPPKNR